MAAKTLQDQDRRQRTKDHRGPRTLGHQDTKDQGPRALMDEGRGLQGQDQGKYKTKVSAVPSRYTPG